MILLSKEEKSEKAQPEADPPLAEKQNPHHFALQSGGGKALCYIFLTFVACGPLGPCSISNSTSCPSSKVLKPSPWMSPWWTNASVPSSAVMNPNPFESLNHFTLPLAIRWLLPYAALLSCRDHARAKVGSVVSAQQGLSSAFTKTHVVRMRLQTNPAAFRDVPHGL